MRSRARLMGQLQIGMTNWQTYDACLHECDSPMLQLQPSPATISSGRSATNLFRNFKYSRGLSHQECQVFPAPALVTDKLRAPNNVKCLGLLVSTLLCDKWPKCSTCITSDGRLAPSCSDQSEILAHGFAMRRPKRLLPLSTQKLLRELIVFLHANMRGRPLQGAKQEGPASTFCKYARNSCSSCSAGRVPLQIRKRRSKAGSRQAVSQAGTIKACRPGLLPSPSLAMRAASFSYLYC